MAGIDQARPGAEIIHRSFDDYSTRFRAITRQTIVRFERSDWAGIRRDTVKRLNLHAEAIGEAFEALKKRLNSGLSDPALWSGLKEEYALEILGRDDSELAQTFFNSLSRRVFPHVGVDPMTDFVAADFPLPYRGWEMASARLYAMRRVDAGGIRRILEDASFDVPFRRLNQDAAAVADRVGQKIKQNLGDLEIQAVDVLRPVFIRNKAAYIVGRIRAASDVLMPLILVILNDRGELVVDAVLTEEEEASIVFSFARWYFHADVASPRQVIGFLHSLVPRKRIAELYVSLGYNKHGKTEFYRDLMRVISASDERFIFAPGQPGLVMSVFTLPSFPFVFKVIRDCFPPAKKITRNDVLSRYREVLRHDRVGRLVDFQEFEHLSFPRNRFSDDLLEELQRTAANTVRMQGDDVVISHLYIGRRVTPLDLFVRQAPPRAAEVAVIEWGNTLKDLATANIFAGDMLLKNFGVTRHGRVVFYDYDELCPLVDCNFRRVPVASHHDDELAAEPWYSVTDADVFPEEMRTFLGLCESLRRVFEGQHADLFDVDFWREMQERNRRGEVIDFFPYGEEQRIRGFVPDRDPAGASPA